MQVNYVNNYQNFNGAAKMLQTAANHVKNNAWHYYMNGVSLATGAVLGNNSIDKVIASKLLLDSVEATYSILRKRRTTNGFAHIDRPLTNTMIWAGKGIWKLMEKFFPKNIH